MQTHMLNLPSFHLNDSEECLRRAKVSVTCNCRSTRSGKSEKDPEHQKKVIRQENPVGHSFEALAKIKDSSDKIDKYLLWSVSDDRV